MRLFIYCAGGFGKEVFDMAKRINSSHCTWDEICFIDDNASLGNEFYGAKLLPLEKVLEDYDVNSFEVTIANGEPYIKKLIYDKLKAKNIKLATLIDDTAIISESAKIGEGAIITPYCSVSSLAVLGNNVELNTKSIVGHDVILGDHCVVSSLVNIGGASSIGESSYLGMGVQIKEVTQIGKDVIIGMGSVVYNDIPDEMIALGNPARPMRKNVDKRVFNKSK
jgi:sugar O-acyltransferase (sialic acid O-acetyltransferase NeuD family)